MNYSIENQQAANDSATVLVFLKDQVTPPDGNYFYRRTTSSVGNGQTVRGALNQINGLIAAFLWESLHNERYDGGPFDPAARDELLLLASRKDNAFSELLESCAHSREARSWNMLRRGPTKACNSLLGLNDLVRASFSRDTNKADAYHSLALLFARANKWANARGITVDNLDELTKLLDALRKCEQVVLVDEILI